MHFVGNKEFSVGGNQVLFFLRIYESSVFRVLKEQREEEESSGTLTAGDGMGCICVHLLRILQRTIFAQ